MKFLSRLKDIFLKGLAIAQPFLGITQWTIPSSDKVVQTISQDLAQIADAIVDAERIGAAMKLPGAQKLQVATPLVADIILKSSIVANHKIADPVLFNEGSQDIANGMAKVVNSLHPGGLQVVDKTA